MIPLPLTDDLGLVMANFYLIDQSLRDEGSHHADYVHCLALAACEAGFQVCVGTHRSFRLHASTQPWGSYRACFRNTTYHRCSALAGLQKMKRSQGYCGGNASTFSLPFMIDRFRSIRLNREREWIIQQFSRDCTHFFRGEHLSADDHIFFASLSDLELIGLARFLARSAHTLRPQWSVQFHFNLLNGRPPDYASQSAVIQAVRTQLMTALAPVSYHNLSLYTTTEELAVQYNQLGIGRFEALTYPIAAEFAPTENGREKLAVWNQKNLAKARVLDTNSFSTAFNSFSAADNRHSDQLSMGIGIEQAQTEGIHPSSSGQDPRSGQLHALNVVCPGAIRREKGQGEYIPELVKLIGSTLLADRQVQLIVQKPEKKIGERDKLPISASLSREHRDTVCILPHPLPRADYVNLIRQADIGLLFYDSSVYYSRRAGILGELLAAGKPVIVPAGCWLAEQIAEPIFRYVDSQFENRKHRVLQLSDLTWETNNAPMHGGIINFDSERRPFRFEADLQPTDRHAAFRFDWHWPAESGVYCRVEWKLLDSKDSIIDVGSQVIGHRRQPSRFVSSPPVSKPKPICLIPFATRAHRIQLTIRNAFHASSASLKNLELLIGQAQDEDVEYQPMGAVGVIVPDRDSLAAGLAEMVRFHDHYRRTAEAFSNNWYLQHRPARTIAQLIAGDHLALDVA